MKAVLDLLARGCGFFASLAGGGAQQLFGIADDDLQVLHQFFLLITVSVVMEPSLEYGVMPDWDERRDKLNDTNIPVKINWLLRRSMADWRLRDRLIIEILRMVGLREKEPAFRDQARNWTANAASSRKSEGRTPQQQQDQRRRKNQGQEPHLTVSSTCGAWPWKNSRVLNEPPMKPWAFWAMRGCLMPMAVCRLDLG